MKSSTILLCSLVVFNRSNAEIIDFSLSPPGTSPSLGLSPLNEVIPPNSSGSGGEIGGGIFFDTASLTLSFSIGYGSSSGYTDLSGPAFAWFIHGSGTVSETAPVLFDLSPFQAFASDPDAGGTILGSLLFGPAEANGLLAGLDYINIYTGANPGGEIRAQLVPQTIHVTDRTSTSALLGSVLLGILALRSKISDLELRSGKQ